HGVAQRSGPYFLAVAVSSRISVVATNSSSGISFSDEIYRIQLKLVCNHLEDKHESQLSKSRSRPIGNRCSPHQLSVTQTKDPHRNFSNVTQQPAFFLACAMHVQSE